MTGSSVSTLREMDDASVLSKKLASGHTTSRRLVEEAIARINSMDQQSHCLRAVLELNPDAVAIASELDNERREGKLRGPLHGIPVLIKDNIATGDMMFTSAGSFALDGTHAARDAHLVKLLRERGLVILGKTNMSEWANFRSSKSTDGWSARGGLTLNPYCLDRTASGSSTGSAVAAAAGYVALTVGTETNGSIVSPANMTCTVGLKPTVGLISRDGVIPISFSQDTAGPMTRSVSDAALLLGALTGRDKEDEATSKAPEVVPDYTSFLDANGLKGKRLGVFRNLGESPAVTALFEETLQKLLKLGAKLVDQLACPDECKAERRYVMRAEFKVGIEKYLREFAPQSGLSTVQDLVEWNKRNAKRELALFGQDTFENIVQSDYSLGEEYRKARETCVRVCRTEGIEKLLRENQLDALIAPTGDPAWVIDTIYGDREVFFFSAVPAVAGLPHLTVPMGFVQGLPVGLSFVVPAWSEGALLKFGYAFEQATKVRTAPHFMRTVTECS